MCTLKVLIIRIFGEKDMCSAYFKENSSLDTISCRKWSALYPISSHWLHPAETRNDFLDQEMFPELKIVHIFTQYNMMSLKALESEC